MLPDRVQKQVGFTMWLTCLFKFCPYAWDSKAFRLRKGNRMHQVIHRCVFLFESAVCTFSICRLLQMYILGAEPRPFIMAMLFTFARILEMTCYYQFFTNGDDILYFANQVFAHLDEYRKSECYFRLVLKLKICYIGIIFFQKSCTKTDQQQRVRLWK